jgi:glycopeptide antibiotics resistance protein
MKKSHLIQGLLFFLYMALLVYLVLFSQGFGRTSTMRDYNLVPFKTINNYIRYRSTFGEINYWINIYGNILAFMPLGYFMFVFERRHRFYKGILIPFVVSFVIELAQIRMQVGSFDVDDIILNTFGGFILYFLLLSCFVTIKWMKKRFRGHEKK